MHLQELKTAAIRAALVALLCAPPSPSFSISNHRAITNDALVRSSFTIAGQTVSFKSDAADEINTEQAALDRAAAIGTEFADPKWHFDSDSFVDGASTLADNRRKVIERLKRNPPEAAAARVYLGRALHQIQDFYAHSNWVELGNTDVNPDLGIRPLSFPTAIPNDPADMLCDIEGGTLLPSVVKLTSGYWMGASACSPPGRKCRHGGLSQCPKGLNKDNAPSCDPVSSPV